MSLPASLAGAGRPTADGRGRYAARERRLGGTELRRLREEPHEVLREIADAGGDVVTLRAGPLRAVFPVHPDGVKHVLQDRWRNYGRNTFQYRLLADVTGRGLLALDGPSWLARRRSAQPVFHRGSLDGYLDAMAAAAGRVADDWERAAARGTEVDVLRDMSRYALEVLSATILGAAAGAPEQRNELVHATETLLDHIMARSHSLGLIPDWLPTSGNRRYRAALRVLDGMIGEAIRRARRGAPAGDLLRLLMESGPSPGFTDRQLRDELVTFFIAGHETVASALSWTFHLLGTHPDVDHRVHRCATAVTDFTVAAPETSTLRWTFEEALRLYPPAWITTRRALETDRVCDHPVPAGTLVIVSPFATQRSARFWREPDRFLPERFREAHTRYAHFPFGGGPHLCIGNHFARLEGTVALATLLARFRLEPAYDRVHVEPGVTLRPRGGLRMRPVRR